MKWLVLLLSIVVVLLLARPCRPDSVDFGASLTAAPESGKYRWERFSDGDISQIKLMEQRSDSPFIQVQVGVYIFADKKYYKIVGYYPRTWQEGPPPIPPPEQPVRRHHEPAAMPVYQPVFYTAPAAYCSPRGG